MAAVKRLVIHCLCSYYFCIVSKQFCVELFVKMSKDSETIRQLQEELEQSNATIEALRSDLAIVSTRSRSSSTVDRSTDKELCIVKVGTVNLT